MLESNFNIERVGLNSATVFPNFLIPNLQNKIASRRSALIPERREFLTRLTWLKTLSISAFEIGKQSILNTPENINNGFDLWL